MDVVVTIGLRIEGVDVENSNDLREALKSLPRRIVEFAEVNEIEPEDLRNFLLQVVENAVEANEQA